MKFSSIQKESDNIINLLSECFKKYEVDLLNLRYDFSEREVMKVAEISRDACNYHENGVVILLEYLFKACKKLENTKESVSSIEGKMNRAINKIYQKYPPGEGLKNE